MRAFPPRGSVLRKRCRRRVKPRYGCRDNAYGSGQYRLDDVTRDVGQPVVAAAVAIGELLMVDAHEVQDRGVQVVNVHLVLDGMPTELVGGAVCHAPLDAA